MRRVNPVSIRVRAPSRGLVTRWPSESADLLPSQGSYPGVLGPYQRAAAVSQNTRYEDGVTCNAPGYDRINVQASILSSLVAHWNLDELNGTRKDSTLNHHDLTEIEGSPDSILHVTQVPGQFAQAAFFPAIPFSAPPVASTFILVDDDVVTGPAGDCFGGFVIGTTAYISNGGDFWSSTDGLNWTDLSSVSVFPNSMATDGVNIVAVGNFFGGGQTSLSTDTGLTWTTHSIGSTGTGLYVMFGGGNFLVVCDNGDVAISPNGVSWTRTNLVVGGAGFLFGAAYGAGVYVIVGTAGTLYSSPDGTTWTQQVTGLVSDITSVVYNGSQFLAVSGSNIITSPDGITWTAGPTPPDQFLTVAFFDGQYMAGVNTGATSPVIYTSPDGITWTAQSPVATASRTFTSFTRLAANTYIVTEGTHS